MSNINQINIKKSDLKYKFAPKKDQSFLVELEQKQKEIVETDRNSSVSLLQVYDDERQKSTKFRPTFKLQFISDNVYAGTSTYKTFENRLYYSNVEQTIRDCKSIWEGFPNINEFSFIREDNNVVGYTTDDGTTLAHVYFEPESASTYNWLTYLSYPYKNINIPLQYHIKNDRGRYEVLHDWMSEDGIPFIIRNTNFNGRNIISFICPVDHGLNVGDAVKISFKVNNNDIFTVDSLGTEIFGSEGYVFNIEDIGYNGFSNDRKGTFKRIVEENNPTETMSKYYVREHKIITKCTDSVVNKIGFELNSFDQDKKLFFKETTPDKKQKIVERNANQSYSITFKKDININGIYDNQKRPLTELFLTVVHRGYFGWFNNPNLNSGGQNALKFGYDFNIKDESTGWWQNTNNASSEKNIKVNSFSKDGFTFFYNEPLNDGDVIYGDFCEWNEYEQTERVISKINHKIRFNPLVFKIETSLTQNPPGYYYQTHYPITIREYSTYIETATLDQKDAAPDYSFFSKTDQSFRWRDIYTYGFIDEQNVGVDYPFINGTHYPYKDVIFKLKPEGSYDYFRDVDLINSGIVQQPNTDDCE